MLQLSFPEQSAFTLKRLEETCWEIRVSVSRCTLVLCARWMIGSTHVPFWDLIVCGSRPSTTLLVTPCLWVSDTGLPIYIRGDTHSILVFQHKLPLPWNQLLETCWEFTLFILVPFTFSLAEWRLSHMFHFLIQMCVQAVIHLSCWEQKFVVLCWQAFLNT